MAQEIHMAKDVYESFTKILCRNQNKPKKAIVKDLGAQG
jgi:hypothetical protein